MTSQYNRLNIENTFDYFMDKLELIKLLIFKYDKEITNWLDFDNDDIFKDPLLFAYFNSSLKEMTLEQLIWGKGNIDSRPNKIKAYTNQDGVIYLSNIGYFECELKKSIVDVSFINNKYIVKYNNRNILFNYQKIDYIYFDDDIKLELAQYDIPILKDWLRLYDPRVSIDLRKFAKYNIPHTTKIHRTHIVESLSIIKNNSKFLFELLRNVKLLVVQNNYDCISKIDRNVYGVFFISVQENYNKWHFVDTIIRLIGFNYGYDLSEESDYFEIDNIDETKVEDIIDGSKDYRSIRSIFIWNFPILFVIRFFDSLVSSSLSDINALEKVEIVGRILHYYNLRYRINTKELKACFSNKAFEIHSNIIDEIDEITKKYFHINKFISRSNLADFQWDKFLSENSTEIIEKLVTNL